MQTDTPLAELKRLLAQQKTGVMSIENAQRLPNLLMEHADYLLAAAEEAEAMREEIAHYDAARIWLNDQLEGVRRVLQLL